MLANPQQFSAALASAVLLLTTTASSQPTAPAPVHADPVLTELIEDSLAARPELASAVATLTAERQRVPQAGALPDPTLQLGIQNDGFNGLQIGTMESSYWQIMASQTFPWPGKRGLRTEVAELSAQQAATSVARLRLSTEAEVRRAYLDLMLARDRLVVLDQLESLWRQSAEIARTRYEVGQGAQSDVLRSQLELNRIRQRRAGLQVDASNAVHALNRLRARPLNDAIEPGSRIGELALPTLADDDVVHSFAVASSPELAAARLNERQAERTIDLAQKSFYPDLTVSAGLMPRGQLEPMWSLSIGGTIPVFAGSKQNRQVAESRARLEASVKNAAGVEQVLRLRVEQRRTAVRGLLETIGLYRDGLLVQSEATASSTLAQYQVGRVPFASVLEANAGLINDRDAYLQTVAQAHRLVISDAELSLDPVVGTSAGGMGTSSMPGSSATSPGGSLGSASPPLSSSSVGGASSSMSGM